MVCVIGCLTPFTTIGSMVLLPRVVPNQALGQANALMETIWQGRRSAPQSAAASAWPSGGLPQPPQWTPRHFGSRRFASGPCTWSTYIEVRVDSDRRSLAALWLDVRTALLTLYRCKPVWVITVAAFALNAACGQLEISLPIYAHRQLSGDASLLWFHGRVAAYLSLASAGAVFAGYGPLARTVVQRLVPDSMRGRVMAFRGSIIAAGLCETCVTYTIRRHSSSSEGMIELDYRGLGEMSNSDLDEYKIYLELRLKSLGIPDEKLTEMTESVVNALMSLGYFREERMAM